jgi:hypothetical protein
VTARKPPGMTWESWIDRQVREAQERGEFDELPGAGKPIAGLDQPRDALWWVKQLLQREELSVTPPTLALRRDVELARERIARAPSESAVRQIVAELNARIVEVNRKATTGPPSTVMPLDVEEVVSRWQGVPDRDPRPR